MPCGVRQTPARHPAPPRLREARPDLGDRHRCRSHPAGIGGRPVAFRPGHRVRSRRRGHRGGGRAGDPGWSRRRVRPGLLARPTIDVSTYRSVGCVDARSRPARRAQPVAERLFERHLATTKEWFPHELVPWSRGRDFTGRRDWSPTRRLSPARCERAVRQPADRGQPAVLLPRRSSSMFGDDEAWGAWARRWTAEEGRHSIVDPRLPDGDPAIDPVALERGRMRQVGGGSGARRRRAPQTASSTSPSRSSPPASPTATPASCSTIRSATTSWPASPADENLHYLFYRDLVDGGASRSTRPAW